MKKIISFTITGLTWLFSVSNAVDPYIPGASPGDPDYPIDHGGGTGTTSIFDVIRFVNNYLRYGIGFVCFLFIIRNGYQLIMARGNTEQMKKATKALMGFGVGVVVALLAVAIVRLATRLF